MRGTDGVVRHDGFRPAAILYEDGTIADQDMTIGLGGGTVTALAQAPQRVYEEKKCADVQGISTPPIPPGGWKGCSSSRSPDRAKR